MGPLLERLSPISPSPTSEQIGPMHAYRKHMHVYVYRCVYITDYYYKLGILGTTLLFLS